MTDDAAQLFIDLLDGRDEPLASFGGFAGGDSVQIGRHASCDIVLRDPTVSRSHASIFYDDDAWHCSCFGRNGMQINDQQLSHCELSDGMKIQFGRDSQLLRVRLDSSVQSLSSRDTIGYLIDGIRDGDDESTQKLWTRCFGDLVRLARHRLGTTSRRFRDEEDVAASVFASLFFGAAEGKFPELIDRDSLWRLLVVITARKAADYINEDRAQKRGGGRVCGDSVADIAKLAEEHTIHNVFDRFLSADPTPESLLLLDDQIQHWMALLPDNEHRQIALWRLEGYANNEIGDLADTPLRTVERRITTIRRLWASRLQEHDDDMDETAFL